MSTVVKMDPRQLAERGFQKPKKDLEAYQSSQADAGIPEAPIQSELPVKQHIIETIPARKQVVRKLKVAAYCRVSTDFDTQGSSIEAQREHWEQEILSDPEWELAGIYLELGISGTKVEIRPELQRMIKDCKAGKIDLILTKSISRFARNTQDCLEMVRTLTGIGVNLYFERENIHTGTMDSELMLSLLACFAQDESHSISSNLKWGIRKRMQDGTYKSNKAPYGYRWDGEKMKIVPGQAVVVKRIFQMALSGNGMAGIAKQLNAEGISAPKGKQWTQSTLKQIIHNPAYKGDMLYQKTYIDEHYKMKINRGDLDQFYEEGHHPPIIDPDIFDKVQNVSKQWAKENGYVNGRDRNRSTHKYCFSGLLYCAECGSLMYRTAWNDRYISWNCKTHKTGPELCSMKPQPEADLKNAFINCLNKLAWSQKRRASSERILDVYEALLGKTQAEKNEERLAEIEKEIEKNREETSRLMGIVMRERFRPEHREKKALLTSQMAELIMEKSRLLQAQESGGTLPELKNFIAGWKPTGTHPDFPEEAFENFVEKCTVDSQCKVTFHFYCGLSLSETLYRSEAE